MPGITLFKSNALNGGIIPLPGSKSESNRALLVNALCDLPGKISNLAIARDTEIMQELLTSENPHYDARDAGTVMRFMTAYLSVMKRNSDITGTKQMKKRTISILVEALCTVGVDITYGGEQGFPPLKIGGLDAQKTSILEIASDVSSQYISALLMIAPKLPQGLSLTLTGEPVSTPYIDMTVAIMDHFGVTVDVVGRTYKIAPQSYTFSPFEVESDWSGASYWYAIFALSGVDELRLSGLKEKSFQGDSMVATIMKDFGVVTSFEGNSAVLTRAKISLPPEIDFVKCPDLAQTFAVLCAVVGHKCTFTGLQTLKIKETDRILALRTELHKIGADFIEDDNKWTVIPRNRDEQPLPDKVSIKTYDDHRMAMAFAALATCTEVEFDDAEVVNKSYPTFWQDLKKAGFSYR